MQTKEKERDRRVDQRMELPIEISLFDKSGKAVNISATGVYFDVITDDMEAFLPGTVIPIQMVASTTTPGVGERKIKLSGNGTIVRNKVKNITSQGNELGVAVQFNEQLNVSDFSEL